MGMFSSINMAASGLTAERLRLDVIADNIANVNTTRTTEGGPFRRSRVIFRPRVEQPYWRSPFLPTYLQDEVGQGVRVAKVEKDYASEPAARLRSHAPGRDQDGPKAGYVEFPNVNIVNEMVDMIEANTAYEANSAVINATKAMFLKALEIGR